MSDPAPPSAGGQRVGLRAGGLIAWFSASLAIAAEDLDPEEITRLLGVEPDEAQRKGVRLPPRGARPGRMPTRGMWSINLRPFPGALEDVTAISSLEREGAIGLLLDRLTAGEAAWAQATADRQVRLFVGLRLDDYNRGFGLSAALMRRIAERGSALTSTSTLTWARRCARGWRSGKFMSTRASTSAARQADGFRETCTDMTTASAIASCLVLSFIAVATVAPPANAALCADGVYRAGCAGPNGAVVVRKPPVYYHRPAAVVVAPRPAPVIVEPRPAPVIVERPPAVVIRP